MPGVRYIAFPRQYCALHRFLPCLYGSLLRAHLCTKVWGVKGCSSTTVFFDVNTRGKKYSRLRLRKTTCICGTYCYTVPYVLPRSVKRKRRRIIFRGTQDIKSGKSPPPHCRLMRRLNASFTSTPAHKHPGAPTYTLFFPSPLSDSAALVLLLRGEKKRERVMRVSCQRTSGTTPPSPSSQKNGHRKGRQKRPVATSPLVATREKN